MANAHQPAAPAATTVPPPALFGFDMERAPVRVELRAAKGSENKVDGYAQLYGSKVNDRGETFAPGSGAKTIAERVPARRVKITDDHQWTAEHTHGVVTRAAEDSTGLQFEGDWSAAPNSQAIKTKLAEGIVDEWSIEFRALQEEYQRVGDAMIRNIGEYFWRGLSCTPYSSQGEGTTLAVRNSLAAGLTPYAALPLAPLATPWDAAAAQERVLAWAQSVSAPARLPHLRRAFLCEARSAGGSGGYSLLIADVVGDRLCAVPAGIMAAARQLLFDDEGGAVRAIQLRSHLDRYYDRMRAELNQGGLLAPWTYSSIDSLLAEVRTAAAIAASPPPDGINELVATAREILDALPQKAREELGVPTWAGPEPVNTAAPPPTSEVDSAAEAARQPLAHGELDELELELQLLQ